MDIQYKLYINTKSNYCHKFTNFKYKKIPNSKMHDIKLIKRSAVSLIWKRREK